MTHGLLSRNGWLFKIGTAIASSYPVAQLGRHLTKEKINMAIETKENLDNSTIAASGSHSD
jgi:hypothetical protein